MSETSSDTDMSEEHSSLLDFVLEASDENQNFAASNVAEIMENFVCPPSTAEHTTYTDLSSNDYCNFDGNGGYSPNTSSPTSQLVYHSGAVNGSDWEHASCDVMGWAPQSTYTFPQQAECTNSSGYSQVSSIFVETNQHFQAKDFLGLSPGKSTQQHHVTHRRQSSGSSNSSKSSKRRRVTTVAQRKAANVRERRRMFNLNEAFDLLRKRVPAFSYEKRLSRIDTLRLAVTYIGFMEDVVKGKRVDQVKLRELESQFAELKKANALPSASRPKPKNSASQNSSRSTRSSKVKKTENMK